MIEKGGVVGPGRLHSFAAGGPKRILIDSMIVDHILATSGLLEKIRRAWAQGGLVIIETHILRDQLSATPDESRRGQLLAVYEGLPKGAVATSAFVLDASRLDFGELGDQTSPAAVGRLTTPGGLGGLKDALLAITASGKADIFVTEDGKLRERCVAARVNCEVWSFEDFRAFVEGAVQ